VVGASIAVYAANAISGDAMKNSQLSDGEFLAAFESATLADFHHVDHVRAAWIYLRRLPFLRASERMAESVWHFAARHGAHMKYHETITQAWMLLVRDALEQDRQAGGGERTPTSEADPGPLSVDSHANHVPDGFDAFSSAHPELLDAHALDRFYSPQLLASPAARAQFVPPDLSPLPGPARNPDLYPLFVICNW
jgi:hypothetical protein